MFRFALIAYLSLTTVFRPALCCCATVQILPGSKCCSVATTGRPLEHKSHKNLPWACQVLKPVLDGKHPQPDQKPTPCDPDGKSCPCGKQFAKMAFTASAGIQLSYVDVDQSACAAHLLSVVDIQSVDTQQVSFLAHSWHSDRYGREMLRAYQIMRC